MSKRIGLELDGNLTQGFRAVLEIGAEGQYPEIVTTGMLPPNPTLATHLVQWQQDYQQLRAFHRALKPQQIKYDGSLNPRAACTQSAQILVHELKDWLRSPSFQEIEHQLRQALAVDDLVRILIRTEDRQLHSLPWHLWQVVEDYPRAEVAFGAPRFRRPPLIRRKQKQVRVLAVLGDRRNINVESDRHLLADLPNADVLFLVEPSRRLLHDHLCEQAWDILFFAGHSETSETGQGVLKLNSEVYLTIDEVKYGISRAVAKGLQLVILNSCDGLGLAYALEELQLPQIIVMRQAVPDLVAQEFLKYFLKAFAQGAPLYLAEREARERLQGLEDEFPCASWLPVIYQHPATIPPDWQDLHRPSRSFLQSTRHRSRRYRIGAPRASCDRSSSWQHWQHGLVISAVITSLILGIRAMGWMQGIELQAFDHLMRLRPSQEIDSRILVIEVTEADTNQYGYPLSDALLADLVQTLASLQPTAIGLDMHRYQPRGEGRDQFITQFQQHPFLFTVCSFNATDLLYAPPPEFSAKQLVSQVGFSDLIVDRKASRGHNLRYDLVTQGQESDRHEIVRRHLLSYHPQLAKLPSTCTTPYSLSLQLAGRFLEQADIQPIQVTAQQDWQFGQVIFPKLTQRFSGYQRLDGRSNQLMINYRAAPPGQRATLNQVLQGQVKSNFVQNRIVLVGTTAPMAKDSFKTSYGDMPGVWIHAHIVSQILSAVIEGRPLIWSLPQWQGWQWGDSIWIWIWSLSGVALTWRIRSWLWLGLSLLIMALALHQICLAVLIQGGWIPLFPPLLSLSLTSVLSILICGIPRKSKLN